MEDHAAKGIDPSARIPITIPHGQVLGELVGDEVEHCRRDPSGGSPSRDAMSETRLQRVLPKVGRQRSPGQGDVMKHQGTRSSYEAAAIVLLKGIVGEGHVEMIGIGGY